ncbi:MAG: DUF1236 domain-containing protein [bacterium]
MRAYAHSVTLGFALLAGTAAANAQTVITREIVDQPVETVITRQPAETLITRQPVAAVPAETVVSQPYQTVQTVRTVRQTRTIHRRVATSRHTARRVQTRATRVTRTVLSPAEQRTLYRVITRERVVPARTTVTRVVTVPRYATPVYAPPAYSEPAYAGPVYTEPAYQDGDANYVAAATDPYSDEYVAPQTTVVAPAPAPVEIERVVTPPPATIAVGAPLPATIPVYALPPTAVSEVPGSAGYRYAYVNDRVLLVDPATHVVVATLAR